MITVLYSCPKCGLKDVSVQIPAREGEEVVVWMNHTVGRSLAIDHEQRSPECHPETLKDVKIPIDGADFIGQQVE